jgi:hypothetical protein
MKNVQFPSPPLAGEGKYTYSSGGNLYYEKIGIFVYINQPDF